MLTTKQLAVFNFIAKFIHDNSVSPTLKQIQTACKMKSTFMAYSYVRRICDKGYLKKHPNQPQGIEIVKRPTGSISPSTETEITNTSMDLLIRAAYARGVRDGRREALDDPDGLNRLMAERHYKRGYAAGAKTMPKTLVEAFERGERQGVSKGRRERADEIRLLTAERESIL